MQVQALPGWRRCHAQSAAPQASRRMACRALQQGPQGMGPSLAAADKSSQSLLESGIRGSMAVTVAYVLHKSLFSGFHAYGPADDMATAAIMAMPVMLLDAATLLPRHEASSASHRTESMSITSAALQQAQAHTLQHSATSSMPQQLLLGAAAQLSEELVMRALLLTLMADWLSKRLIEAGADDMLTLGSTLHMPTAEAAQWVSAAAICTAMYVRYADHSRRSARRVRRAAALEAAAAAQRARIMAYEPQTVAATLQQGQQWQQQWQQQGPGCAAQHDSEAAAQVAERAQQLLGLRAVAGQAALFATFIMTGNLAASLGGGLLMQTAAAAFAHAQRHSRSSL